MRCAGGKAASNGSTCAKSSVANVYTPKIRLCFLVTHHLKRNFFFCFHHHRTTQLPRDLASATFVDGCLALRAHAAVLRVFRVSQRLNQVRIAR
jgi:hypothetical protein